MKQQSLTGKCNLCGKSFSRASMTRHLKSCGQPAEKPAGWSFHLFVDARYNKAYWMHLSAPAEATLNKVDAFLREIWLECCGHLSAFNIGGMHYDSGGAEDSFGGSDMGVRLSRILEPGMVFSYEYDFGSTTDLNLKVVGVRDRTTKRRDIEVLARNDAPAVVCDRCGGQPATHICPQCSPDRNWYCKSCARDHDCGDEDCLPVVNSPRAGVCGYEG